MSMLLTYQLHQHQKAVELAVSEVEKERITARIWEHDFTVWKPDPTEITNRLGWLHAAEAPQVTLNRLQALLVKLRRESYTHALLLGMGGSSLAPQVFRNVFGVRSGFLDLQVLDSTAPAAVLDCVDRLESVLEKTLFVVSTKSGVTVETLSLFKYFYNWVVERIGRKRAGEHFVAVTDPVSHLADLAEQHRFWMTFLNDANIGGRYSALSYFGLVPAALVGVNTARILQKARAVARRCGSRLEAPAADNPGVVLGVILGELAKAGRDKLTLVISPKLASFADWVEQLIAESTGKEGKGILPVVGEPIGSPKSYGNDRLFVYIRLEGDETHIEAVQAIEDSGHPLVRLELEDEYDLGGQFFLWEFATAIAGYRLGINPFDQPNIESAKALARQQIEAFRKSGELPAIAPSYEMEDILIYTDERPGQEKIQLESFLRDAPEGAYVALQAFLPPTADIEAALQFLRNKIWDFTRLPTTIGFGPRFLHSTGQLHKGDSGRGLFIQITADDHHDVPVPDEAGSPDSSLSFGILKTSQASGDRQALLDAGRQVLRFHIKGNIPANLKRLVEYLF